MYSENCGLQSVLMSWGHDGKAIIHWFHLVQSKQDLTFICRKFYIISITILAMLWPCYYIWRIIKREPLEKSL